MNRVRESVSRSVVSDTVISWAVAHQAPLSMGFSRQEYWSGLCPFPGDLPNPGIEPESPTSQADALTSSPPGKPTRTCLGYPEICRDESAKTWGRIARDEPVEQADLRQGFFLSRLERLHGTLWLFSRLKESHTSGAGLNQSRSTGGSRPVQPALETTGLNCKVCLHMGFSPQ